MSKYSLEDSNVGRFTFQGGDDENRASVTFSRRTLGDCIELRCEQDGMTKEEAWAWLEEQMPRLPATIESIRFLTVIPKLLGLREEKS